jgi:RimJ/RimL family protein N-acetyltransferase
MNHLTTAEATRRETAPAQSPATQLDAGQSAAPQLPARARPSAAAPLPNRVPLPAKPYPAHLVESTTLRDGLALTIRPIRAADIRLERAFVDGLSPSTRYQRLLSGRQLLPGELKRLTDIDYRRELALVAVATIDGEDRLLGVARYVRDDGVAARGCDFALVIGDAWQGRGLGELLLRRLLHAALADGIEVVGGITLSSNGPMLALAMKLGFSARREHGNASVTDLRWQAIAVHRDAEASIGAVAHADLWQPDTAAAPVAAPQAADADPCGCVAGRSARPESAST